LLGSQVSYPLQTLTSLVELSVLTVAYPEGHLSILKKETPVGLKRKLRSEKILKKFILKNLVSAQKYIHFKGCG